MICLLWGLAAAELYTDLTLSEEFQQTALAKRHEHFWNVVEESAGNHEYAEAAEALQACLSEIRESAVTKILAEALAHLEMAAGGTSAQNSRASEVAEAALENGPGYSPVRSPSDFFAKLYGTFIAEEKQGYQAKLRGQVEERQKRSAEILKGSIASDVLTHTRLASKLAFDALKYDIYQKNVPKTPEEAKAIANKIVELQTAIRKNYLGVVTAIAGQLVEDVQARAGPKLDLPAVEVKDGLSLVESNKIAV